MINRRLLVCLLSVGLLTGCSVLRGSRLHPSRSKGEGPPKRGLQVTRVYEKSPAEAAGIRTMDVIAKYGEFEIVDDAGFFAAKNHYEAAHTPTVEIVVWRGLTRMTSRVRTGWLGVNSQDYDKTSQEFMSMMREINSMHELPQYLIDRGIYKFRGSESEILAKARALVDDGERNGTLTPAQVLLYRIYMILDDAPAEDQQRLEGLLQQLIASQPSNYVYMVGSDKFFKDNRYHAAIACFKERLKQKSDDASTRLDLGVAYNEIGMYREANSAADYVFDHQLAITKYGEAVGYQVKAIAALGLKDYRATIANAKQAFSREPEPYTVAIMQLAAAESGDLELIDEASQQLKAASWEKYSKMRLPSDAVKAYALVKANQNDRAARMVKAWRTTDGAEGQVIDYWRAIPQGTVVSKTFGQLMKS